MSVTDQGILANFDAHIVKEKIVKSSLPAVSGLAADTFQLHHFITGYLDGHVNKHNSRFYGDRKCDNASVESTGCVQEIRHHHINHGPDQIFKALEEGGGTTQQG
ncbi:unnamed protein product [Acanthoscelides obtectus]|uniref:Uncharacterized protein n=1 Tax=Acanthoscelides obtectus TaxID=200917 RepID=A0A9P0K1J8_ACAOB|nr:unnamed protein product [Acanthoscelides obtectus]CAK1648982.1 hypothetical protein AOBTE_LOCUS15983 [Acanthoscelides obtectus]